MPAIGPGFIVGSQPQMCVGSEEIGPFAVIVRSKESAKLNYPRKIGHRFPESSLLEKKDAARVKKVRLLVALFDRLGQILQCGLYLAAPGVGIATRAPNPRLARMTFRQQIKTSQGFIAIVRPRQIIDLAQLIPERGIHANRISIACVASDLGDQ